MIEHPLYLGSQLPPAEAGELVEVICPACAFTTVVGAPEQRQQVRWACPCCSARQQLHAGPALPEQPAATAPPAAPAAPTAAPAPGGGEGLDLEAARAQLGRIFRASPGDLRPAASSSTSNNASPSKPDHRRCLDPARWNPPQPPPERPKPCKARTRRYSRRNWGRDWLVGWDRQPIDYRTVYGAYCRVFACKPRRDRRGHCAYSRRELRLLVDHLGLPPD